MQLFKEMDLKKLSGSLGVSKDVIGQHVQSLLGDIATSRKIDVGYLSVCQLGGRF